jgi:hypothetical protein
MNLAFPSREFDDAVAAVCHGVATDEQAVALGELLRGNLPARDEYLFRVALHAHLSSEPGLFADSAAAAVAPLEAATFPHPPLPAPAGRRSARSTAAAWSHPWAWAAGLVLLLGAAWGFLPGRSPRPGETSRAVAMLNRVVGARWKESERPPRLGAPLEPGTLHLESGLAQVVFYNGARVVIEGPAEFRLVSSSEAVCLRGTLTAEVPPQARGFKIVSPRLDVTDLGTAFGLKVAGDRSELHVFEGHVAFRAGKEGAAQDLRQGKGAVMEPGGDAPKLIAADRAGFSGLFDLQAKSVAAEARRYDQWRASTRKLQLDPSLWVHLDFEHGGAPAWRLPNAATRGPSVADATIVGCEWREGRWATKPALEFHGVSDRVRLNVPGDLESVTLAAWVRVQGLDRQINSLFMSDGFIPGTIHWVIRQDGVLGLTVIGEGFNHQILASPPVLAGDQLGVWTHLAVVLDGRAQQVVHYVNGRTVSRHELRIPPPYRIGTSELGNWNANGYPGNDPFLIRHFSGAMDEFCLFNRALTAAELGSLYSEGRPQAEPQNASIPPATPFSVPLPLLIPLPIPDSLHP